MSVCDFWKKFATRENYLQKYTSPQFIEKVFHCSKFVGNQSQFSSPHISTLQKFRLIAITNNVRREGSENHKSTQKVFDANKSPWRDRHRSYFTTAIAVERGCWHKSRWQRTVQRLSPNRVDVNKLPSPAREKRTRQDYTDAGRQLNARAPSAKASRVIRDNTSCTSLPRREHLACISAVHRVHTRAHKQNLFDYK